MINEFDKEMDSLLRRAAGGGGGGGEVVSMNPGAHVDADEITLFAENALTVKARQRVTGHLADCNRCRKILSSVITLNAETESEIIHPKAAETLAASIPWYKKMFVFPQIAFAMGALAVVFGGAIAFIVLQNARESQNSSLARIEEIQERPKGANGASSDGETASSESYSMSNSTVANTAATSSTPASSAMSSNMSANSVTKSSAPVSPANSNALASRDDKQAAPETDAEVEFKVAAPKEKPAALSKLENSIAGAAPAAVPKKDSNYTTDADESRAKSKVVNEHSQNSVVQNQQNISPDSRSVRQLPLNSRAVNRQNVETTSADTVVTVSNEKNKKSAETRTAAGKVFKRADNAWYDSAYSGQRTTNVRRGTDEYKKLDAGLRSIAVNIGGTLVVVWKGKAYRIQ